MDKAGVEEIFDNMGATNIYNYKYIAYSFALIPAVNTIMCMLCIITIVEEGIKMRLLKKTLKLLRDNLQDGKTKDELSDIIDKM